VKFVVAVHGTRGDIEPCAAVGLELLRRGHDVRVAVPPNLVSFVETAGLAPAVSYGVDSQKQLDADIFRDFWKLQNPKTALRQGREYISQGWAEMSEALTPLATDADLILTGTTYQEVAANVAEHHGIPLAALHYFPARANSHIVPIPLPLPLIRAVWAGVEWVHWQTLRQADDQQRRVLGLAKGKVRSTRRIIDHGTLEIQAFDKVFFPGLEQEWGGKRPLVGAITMERGTDTDDEVAAWMAAGKPPIYFGFGSMPVQSPDAAVAMIRSVCAELGERALICSGVWDLAEVPDAHDVKIVRTANHATVFPACRAVVHHGGAGTTAAGVRAGVPTVVLWVGAEQPIWANQIKRLRVGAASRFTSMTRDSLRDALQTALSPACVARARELATQMTTPATSVSTAADLLEKAARSA
jgi:UDP:flavonoid glycosyltransferase YjiC (YdhE family)